MNRHLIAASVLVLAVAGVNCGRLEGSGNGFSAAAMTAPSAVGNEVNGTMARGGNGGGKGKPGNGAGTGSSGGTLTWVMVVDANGNNAPNWGDQITWSISQNVTTEPYVEVSCTQNGVAVYSALWPWTETMTLSSMMWASGAAECVADGYYFDGMTRKSFATNTFTALAQDAF